MVILLLSGIFFYMFAGAVTFIVPTVIILSTFFCGIMISGTVNQGKKKVLFLSGLVINLGLLVFFKYINFIITSTFEGINFISKIIWSEHVLKGSSVFLKLIIPLGISFITFQAVGYLIEIYRGSHIPEKNLGVFATYLLFFPKLLSGPIERAHNFIPQLRLKHELNYEQIVEGLKRILWGLFLKIVVADRLALYTDAVFNNCRQHSGITLLVASVFFTVQLFSDFAGYTSIAIGSARILGYRLMENFNSPFMAKSIAEFWGRWHISLSNWLRDYLFLPLSYSVARRAMKKSYKVFKVEYISYITGILITMTICGIWHGASWNFVIFGFLQGFIMTVELLTRKVRKKVKKIIPSWLDTLGGMGFTFAVFSFTTIFFKANTVTDAFFIVGKIFTASGPFYIGEWQQIIYCFLAVFLLLIVSLSQEYSVKKSLQLKPKYWFISQIGYVFLIILILLIGVFDGGQFIYFQF